MLRFDHIVIGAGTAGCIVAERLSRDRKVKVLLIESGAAPMPDGTSLDMFTYLQGEGRLDETMEAQRYPGGPRRPYARGTGLGGSNAINGLVSMAGSKADYDTWASEFGCSKWSWTEIEKALRLLLESTAEAPSTLFGDADRLLMEAARRIGLPFGLSTPPRLGGDGIGGSKFAVNDLQERSFEGIQQARLQLSPDATSPSGFRRNPTALSALAIASSRANLTIESAVPVRTVRFDRSISAHVGGEVTSGVRLSDGREFDSPSVLCCAGAIQTPALLLRSEVDLPGIGANLQDHPALAFSTSVEAPASVGQLTSATLLHARSRSNPDVWIQVLPMNQLGLNGPARHHIGLMAAAMKNHGRGSVTLGTDDEPVVRFDLLSDQRDLEILQDVLDLLVRLADASDVPDENWFVDDQGTTLRTLKKMDAAEQAHWSSNNLANYAHAAGTCRMGEASDPMAVVDQSGVVLGHTGLRVIDASVFPTLPQANPNLTVMLVAQRMADWAAQTS